MSKITFTRPDGAECSGYYFEPAQGAETAPGLVVIQEWWGLNDQIKGVAEAYASRGFRVLIPDLYRGKVGLDAKEAEHLMHGLNFGEAASQDVRGAVQYLKQRSAKVGVTGYCMGGALTLLAACFVPEVDAGCAWYGFPPLEYIDASKIRVPLMGHWAIRDAFFPIATVDALEEKLKAAGVRYEFHRYDATHAFANETHGHHAEGPFSYDPAQAQVAMTRTLAFFDANLR